MFALALAAAGCFVQSAADAPTFRVDANLVAVRFQVIPNKGQLIADLRPEDIEIREDGVVQKTALFSGGRYSPHAIRQEISLLFDCSGSVRRAGTLPLRVFHENLLDEYENATIAIYGFSEQCYRLAAPTRDAAVLKKAMETLPNVPAGFTPLFSQIGNTLEEVGATPGNAVRTLLVFSDGLSNQGEKGTARIVELARDLGVAICPVVLPMPPPNLPGARNPYPVVSNAQVRYIGQPPEVHDFKNLAHVTGGYQLELEGREDMLPGVLKRIARQFTYDYVAGYYPQASEHPKRRTVQVVLRSSKRGKLAGGIRTVTH